MTASNDRNGIKFTDEELMQLRKDLEDRGRDISIRMDIQEIEAILSRLESAERVCVQFHARLQATQHILQLTDDEGAVWEAWLKTKGDA